MAQENRRMRGSRGAPLAGAILVCGLAIHHRFCPSGLVEDYTGHSGLASLFRMGVKTVTRTQYLTP